jgi:hypothetical protein
LRLVPKLLLELREALAHLHRHRLRAYQLVQSGVALEAGASRPIVRYATCWPS